MFVRHAAVSTTNQVVVDGLYKMYTEVDEDGTRYVVLIVSLVEEDILAISALSGPVL